MYQLFHIKGKAPMQIKFFVECSSWVFLGSCIGIVVSQSTIAPFPQDGWTVVLVASRYGHKDLVQELCEAFGADFLHRNKVRAMQTVSGSEWLNEYACTQSSCVAALAEWLSGAIMHEVAVSASGSAVCVRGALSHYMTGQELLWCGCH